MDIKGLDKMAKENITAGSKLNINDQIYYIAVRGLYSQYRNGELKVEQAQKEKEMLVNWYEENKQPPEPIKQTIYLNKDKVVEAVILELGRYISCSTTNENREKVYPRKLFEKRIIEVIDKAYSIN